MILFILGLLIIWLILLAMAMAKRAKAADFQREMERGPQEARAELEDLASQPRSSSGETVCPPVRTEPSHSEGGRGDSRRSVAHGPSPLDLPRLGE